MSGSWYEFDAAYYAVDLKTGQVTEEPEIEYDESEDELIE